MKRNNYSTNNNNSYNSPPKFLPPPQQQQQIRSNSNTSASWQQQVPECSVCGSRDNVLLKTSGPNAKNANRQFFSCTNQNCNTFLWADQFTGVETCQANRSALAGGGRGGGKQQKTSYQQQPGGGKSEQTRQQTTSPNNNFNPQQTAQQLQNTQDNSDLIYSELVTLNETLKQQLEAIEKRIGGFEALLLSGKKIVNASGEVVTQSSSSGWKVKDGELKWGEEEEGVF
jgi:hypothetical protein